MLVSSATGLRSTLDNIKAPNSVKAYGSDFLGRFILDVLYLIKYSQIEIKHHAQTANDVNFGLNDL